MEGCDRAANSKGFWNGGDRSTGGIDGAAIVDKFKDFFVVCDLATEGVDDAAGIVIGTSVTIDLCPGVNGERTAKFNDPSSDGSDGAAVLKGFMRGGNGTTGGIDGAAVVDMVKDFFASCDSAMEGVDDAVGGIAIGFSVTIDLCPSVEGERTAKSNDLLTDVVDETLNFASEARGSMERVDDVLVAIVAGCFVEGS